MSLPTSATHGAHLRDPLFLAYLMLVASMPLTRPELFSIGEQPLLLSDVLLVCVYALWGLRWVRGRVRLRFDACLLAALVYLAALALSSVLAGRLFSKDGVKLAAYALLVLLPCLSERIVQGEARALLVVKAWLAGFALSVAIGVLGFVAFYLDRAGLGYSLMCGYGGIKSGNYPRLCAPFRHPNMFANYLAAALPLVVAFGPALLGRGWLLLLLALSGFVVTFTISAALGGFAIAFALMFWLVRRQRGQDWNALDLGVGAAAFAVAAFMAIASVATVVPAGQGTVSLGAKDLLWMDGARPAIWRGVLPNVQAHPGFGMGYGAWVSQATDPRAFIGPDNIHLYPRTVPPRAMEAHNTLLNVLGQSGAVGLSAFLLLLYQFLRRFRAGAASSPLNLMRLAAGAGLVASVGYCGLFAGVEEARHIWALAGLLLIACNPRPT